MIIIKTWPFGARRNVRLQVVTSRFILGKDEDSGEGYALLGGEHEVPPVVGRRYCIEFIPGGPLCGHWRIVSELEEK
ncbi:hypothetical protein OPIT5_08200 [Opitutaceae bacterium TAV5]|nr:hypothetical protein OPIT5_08200 [Opitutaceae bacterium TAV5]